jgi:hypothetical protein
MPTSGEMKMDVPIADDHETLRMWALGSNFGDLGFWIDRRQEAMA